MEHSWVWWNRAGLGGTDQCWVEPSRVRLNRVGFGGTEKGDVMAECRLPGDVMAECT